MVVGTSGISPNGVAKVVETTLYQRCNASILSSDRPSKMFELLIALAECHQGREADIALS